MAEGYYKKVNSTAAVAPTISLDGLFTQNYQKTVDTSTKYQQKEVDTSIDLDEYMDIEITYEPHEEQSWWQAGLNWVGQAIDDVAEVYKNVQATLAVGTTSVLSGVLKIGEHIVDGATWLVAGGADIVGLDDAAKDMREFIARDLVGEANEYFYENTEIGQAINDASYMKYDSDLAKGIQSATEKVGTVVAATAISCIPGAGPVLTAIAGGLYQAGASAESTYQKDTDTTMLQELMILASGGLGALSWATNAQLGKGVMNIYSQFQDIGWEAVGTALKFAFSQKAKAETLAFGNNAMNILASFMQAGGEIATIATKIVNGEDVSTEEYVKLGLEILAYYGMNTLDDMLKSGIKQYNTALLNDNVVEALEAANRVNDKLPTGTTNPQLSGSTPLETIDEELHLYSRGIPSITSRQITVAELMPYLKNPELQAKLLAADYSDEFDGLTKMEIGNAIKDLMKAAEKNGYDLELTDAQLADIQKLIDNASIEPFDFISQEFSSWFARNQRKEIDVDFFCSEEGRKTLEQARYLKSNLELDEFGEAVNKRLDGELTGFMIQYYRTYSEIADTRKIMVLSDDMINDIFKYLNGSKISDEDVRYLQSLVEFNNGRISYENGKILEQLIKKVEFSGYDSVVAERLRSFSGAYVSDSKVDSIIGSCIFETDDTFSQHTQNPCWMAYNNGTQSVMNLKYSSKTLRSTINHESIHQISHTNVDDPITGIRQILAGVKKSSYDPQTQSWTNTRTGINESITEFFNRLTMGEDYAWGTCGYEPAVGKLEELVNLGVVSIDDLKKFYFGNDGAGLISSMTQAMKSIGVKVSGDDLTTMFDRAISDDANVQAQGLQELSKVIKKLTTKQNGGSFTSFLKGLLGK